jgi:O-antigen/teichoic acid export membrane protein
VSIGAGKTGLEVVENEPPGGLRKQAMRGVLWTGLQKWSIRISTLATFILLGRLLEPREFGLVALAMTFISILTIVADAGLANYLVQLQRLTAVVTSTAFYISAFLGLALAAGLAALAGPISAALDADALRLVLPALAVALLMAGLSSVPAALLNKEMRFRELALQQVVATVVSLVVAIALALAGAGVWALVAQHVVRSSVAAVIVWAAAAFRPRWAFSHAEARSMTSYGLKSMLARFGTTLRKEGEIFLIGAIAGTTALGYWTVAGRLVHVIVDLCNSVVGTVAHPVFARLQGERERLARALGTAQATGGLVLVPAMVVLALTSEDVVPAVFGSQWTPAAGIASILAIRSLVLAMSGFNRSALMATGHPGAELAVTTFMLVGHLALAYVFADDDLLLLAAVLTAWAAVSVPLRGVLVHRLLGIPARTYARTTSVLLAGGVAAAAVVGAQLLLDLDGAAYVALAVLLGGAVYLGMVLLVSRSLLLEVFGGLRSALGRRRSRRA